MGFMIITTNNVVVSLIYLEHVYMNIIVSTQALSRPFLWVRKKQFSRVENKKRRKFCSDFLIHNKSCCHVFGIV